MTSIPLASTGRRKKLNLDAHTLPSWRIWNISCWQWTYTNDLWSHLSNEHIRPHTNQYTWENQSNKSPAGHEWPPRDIHWTRSEDTTAIAETPNFMAVQTCRLGRIPLWNWSHYARASGERWSKHWRNVEHIQNNHNHRDAKHIPRKTTRRKQRKPWVNATLERNLT